MNKDRPVEERLMDLKKVIGLENIPLSKLKRIKAMIDDCYNEVKRLREKVGKNG